MLKFHIFIFLTCEESVLIRLICEELVRFFFSDVKKWYSFFHNCHESVPNPHICEESVQIVKQNICVESTQSDDLRI